MYNHLRKYAEDIDASSLNFPYGPMEDDIYDHAKFDRINIYDLRRALP
jgi:hypothetical protein